MSAASSFREKAQTAKAIYKVLGQSGASYIIFWFDDGSVCTANEVPSGNLAAARLKFGAVKPVLDDCGVADFEGATYQKGMELLRRLEQS
jgi:hypothetical protein